MAGQYQSLKICWSVGGAPQTFDGKNVPNDIQLDNGFLVLEFETKTVGYSSQTIDSFEIVYKMDG